MAEATPLVAEGVGRRYRRGRPWAIKDVDLAIPRGSVTALVGPNGAGKSTLIRSWMGFERPDAGRVLVEGFDPRRDRTAAVSRIGYVPQSASLYRNLTVDDHFRFAAVCRPEFDRAHALDRVHSAGVGPERRLGELSGGEQAQVALAIALGTRSPILLLDEPLASLDPLARREFLAVLVDDVKSTGATAILSSHIVTDVEQACDSLVVLAFGRVALHATVARARAEHRTILEPDLSGRTAVGTFSGMDGRRLALVKSSDAGLREATLEEIVLGHLAALRPPRTAERLAA
jgi:ABC-2 type transport system ATP-binding protein